VHKGHDDFPVVMPLSVLTPSPDHAALDAVGKTTHVRNGPTPHRRRIRRNRWMREGSPLGRDLFTKRMGNATSRGAIVSTHLTGTSRGAIVSTTGGVIFSATKTI
jgi:hypothetical protein